MAISTINQNGLNAPLTLTSPVLTTPNLGTPSALVLTNATALPRTAAPSGSVIQTVYSITTTEVSSGSTTFISCGLSGSITPTASGNKFIITVMGTARTDGGSPTAQLYLTLYKNGSNVTDNNGLAQMCNNSTSNGMDMPLSITYYDTAANASSITYAVYMRDGAGRNSRFPSAVNISPRAIMIIQEVVA